MPRLVEQDRDWLTGLMKGLNELMGGLEESALLSETLMLGACALFKGLYSLHCGHFTPKNPRESVCVCGA